MQPIIAPSSAPLSPYCGHARLPVELLSELVHFLNLWQFPTSCINSALNTLLAIHWRRLLIKVDLHTEIREVRRALRKHFRAQMVIADENCDAVEQERRAVRNQFETEMDELEEIEDKLDSATKIINVDELRARLRNMSLQLQAQPAENVALEVPLHIAPAFDQPMLARRAKKAEIVCNLHGGYILKIEMLDATDNKHMLRWTVKKNAMRICFDYKLQLNLTATFGHCWELLGESHFPKDPTIVTKTAMQNPSLSSETVSAMLKYGDRCPSVKVRFGKLARAALNSTEVPDEYLIVDACGTEDQYYISLRLKTRLFCHATKKEEKPLKVLLRWPIVQQ